jgi:hypothetical protein
LDVYAETLPCPKSTTVPSYVHPKGDLSQSCCSIQAGSKEIAAFGGTQHLKTMGAIG